MNCAAAVQDRFNNPFVNHELMSISLNSTSKWKARNLPSFLGYLERQPAGRTGITRKSGIVCGVFGFCFPAWRPALL